MNSAFKRWLLVALCLLAVISVAPPALAQVTAVPEGVCTTDPQYFKLQVPQGTGLISAIVTNVKQVVQPVAASMVAGIENDQGFQTAIVAAATIYIAIYGILFTFGMAQPTIYDFVVRMVKIALIAIMASGNIWSWISGIVIPFFNDGTDALIAQVTSIAVGAPGLITAGDPFGMIDTAVLKSVSSQMWVTWLAMLTTGPMGILFALLLAMALGAFLKAMLNGLWVYLMSLVIKTLLFGLAPIFFSFLLFQRTRHLFDGWLNQIVNASLQPIFLFTFFGFFAKLIEACIDNIFKVPVCMTEWSESLRGSPLSDHFWRFMLWNSQTGQYELYTGLWTFTGPQSGNGPIFPVDIMTILSFLILAELAGKFNKVVVEIAKDIAAAVTDLSAFQGNIGEWFTSVGGMKPNFGSGFARSTPSGGGGGFFGRPSTGAPGGSGGGGGPPGVGASNTAGAAPATNRFAPGPSGGARPGGNT